VKRLALLKELLPDLSRVAVLSNPSNPYCIIAVTQARIGAAALGVELDLVEASEDSDLDKAYRALSRAHPDAVLVIGDPFLVGQRRRIAEFLVEHRLPSMFTFHNHTRAGGLMSYSTNYHDLFRRAAVVVDKIARGTRPGDLPVQQPTVFELIINLKTANALGLTIPPALLARANEVIA
jgi:putative ABC transport system substrate-binding protein